MLDEKSNPIAFVFDDVQGIDDELLAGHKKLFFEMLVSVKPLKITAWLMFEHSSAKYIIFAFINYSPFLIFIDR